MVQLEIFESISKTHLCVLAIKATVEFADLNTEELLELANEPCELILDTDKLIIEQKGEKQYTFPRSKIHRAKIYDTNRIELEMGTRAPVTGSIRFKFLTNFDAENFYQELIKDSIVVTPQLESVCPKISSSQPVNQSIRSNQRLLF